MFGLDPGLTLVLILCLLAACAFEFINGFHDTANAVATVIYTNSLKPMTAVIWSGICNFIGVYFGGIAVAMGIVHLLPNALLLDQSVSHIVALLSAVILTSILWNLGTWYFGLPCSSSHTLLGSIFGVGLAYSFISDTGVALNWGKVKDILLALLISPVIGFSLTMAMVALLKKVVKKKRKLFAEPSKKKAPPLGIRSLIILSSTFVSYTHGSNDGQKGVGLIMIILISLVPVHFALNHHKNPQELLGHVNRLEASVMSIDSAKMGALDRSSFMVVGENIDKIQSMLANQTDFKKLEKKEHYEIRKDIMVLSSEVNQIFVRHLDEREFYVSKDKKSGHQQRDKRDDPLYRVFALVGNIADFCFPGAGHHDWLEKHCCYHWREDRPQPAYLRTGFQLTDCYRNYNWRIVAVRVACKYYPRVVVGCCRIDGCCQGFKEPADEDC
ncbi:MAG TPA: inorganic phosphate transporter [Bacteroidales bacterium]|nr:inorganic phosphate transporter [Bacteroidales bacterium]